MTRLIYKTGDVLNAGEAVVIHGCNCFNTMGAGIAAQVRDQCPNAYAADQLTIRGDISKLGDFTYAQEASGMIVINAYTQYDYSRHQRCLYYSALSRVMEAICKHKRFMTEDIFAMPKIGCGLAGGDWDAVSVILELIADKYQIIFHIYEL
jgi:O-acetyl-ADP-ribose deacetylase (regulator of RNase III)